MVCPYAQTEHISPTTMAANLVDMYLLNCVAMRFGLVIGFVIR